VLLWAVAVGHHRLKLIALGGTQSNVRSLVHSSAQDLEKIADLTLDYYNRHAEDFWEGTRNHSQSRRQPEHRSDVAIHRGLSAVEGRASITHTT
jgi:hypothetical protein